MLKLCLLSQAQDVYRRFRASAVGTGPGYRTSSRFFYIAGTIVTPTLPWSCVLIEEGRSEAAFGSAACSNELLLQDLPVG